uniref:transposase domain-containing protein n=1 Tax=Microbulbifer thermotolerans TaxID=252514 RepID=UPI002B05F623|nr:transposase domain-containing protein [Microbulbifer thermotolerans]
MIETAKRHRLEPYRYLRQVFTELPKARSVEEIERLLPWNLAGTSKQKCQRIGRFTAYLC